MNDYARSPRVLVVEDDGDIADVLVRSLRLEGYEVRLATDGVRALDDAHAFLPDLVILDLGLPRLDGVEVAKQLRADSDDVPILMLTARDALEARVIGLDAGADDYMVKPFGSDELTARVRATLRRTESERPAQFSVPGLHVDFERRTVSARGRVMRLTPKEFELLRHLVTNPGKTLAHRWLLQTVWGPDYGEEMESLRVLINQLRKKIEPDPRNPRYILTEPWVGYRFEYPESK